MAFTFVYIFYNSFPLIPQLDEASVLFALILIMASSMSELLLIVLDRYSGQGGSSPLLSFRVLGSVHLAVCHPFSPKGDGQGPIQLLDFISKSGLQSFLISLDEFSHGPATYELKAKLLPFHHYPNKTSHPITSDREDRKTAMKIPIWKWENETRNSHVRSNYGILPAVYYENALGQRT